MSKFKTMIRKDIEMCDEYIKNGFAKNSEVMTLIGKYVMDYSNFDEGITRYASIPGCETNEIENIRIIRGKLEYLLNRTDNPDLFNKQKNYEVNFSAVNHNTNSNSVTLNMSISDIKNNIDDNTYLSDFEKSELLEKLDEIIELQKSSETKSKKWDKAKKILVFLLDKGADIAIMYIPHILNAINK